ncbi:MAG TPA: LysM peptidoglycan-binding domain-containing protein [Campylobacterales bacterium]|nr:LysM peptidoglycan-binding domain-containing protein [Campylobacterales bacterium]
MSKFLLLLLPLLLFGNFKFNDNYEKQVEILRKFDVDSSFLNDRFLIRLFHKYQSEDKKLFFFRAMSDAILFLPTIKKMLSDSNIPNEFLYLAIAESSLVSRSFSNKHAAGIWQFIPSTARLYGLRVDNYIDERLDMIKSTKVAIKFLSDMYKLFGKWYLAAIAYNCGKGTLRNAIAKAGTDRLEVLIDPEKKYLPKESRIYIRKILALALLEGSDSIFNSQKSYILNTGNTFSIATVYIGGGEKLENVAKDIGMDVKELERLNAHIVYGVTPPDNKKYKIYIPYFKLADFKSKYKSRRIFRGEFEYVVQKGDTLYNIGKRYNCDHESIAKINHIQNNKLYIGQKLKIPILYNPEPPKKEPVISNIPQDAHYSKIYKVKKGDTLYSIAKLFKTDIESLMEKNGLESPNIYIGDSLIVK